MSYIMQGRHGLQVLQEPCAFFLVIPLAVVHCILSDP